MIKKFKKHSRISSKYYAINVVFSY